MIDTFYALYAIKKPITGISPGNLEAVIRHLRAHHDKTNGELPGATGWLELVREAVKDTPGEGATT
jgi:hypothetical protein